MLGRLLTPPGSEGSQKPPEGKQGRLWAKFAASIGQDPFLWNLRGASKHLERRNVFLAFAVALREGQLEDGNTSSGAKVEKYLQVCGRALEQMGYSDPRKSAPGQDRLDRVISSYISKCKEKDPPPRRQIALPNTLIRDMAMETLGSNQTPKIHSREEMSMHLIILAFFFLLRVGEYTEGPKSRQGTKRTVPLRKRDLKLWKGDRPISPDSDWDTLLTADRVSITLDNQKNGMRNVTLSHETSHDPALDPVRAAAHLLHAIQNRPNYTPVGTFETARGRTSKVSAKNVIDHLRLGAGLAGLQQSGYDLSLVGTHSLRASGAVHLHAQGFDDVTIMKLGRWSSNTYLIYIQTQLSTFTRGISQAMASTLKFFVVS